MLENKALHSLFGWYREDGMEIIITERHTTEVFFNKEAAVHHLMSLPVTEAQIISLTTCFQRLYDRPHFRNTQN